MNDRTAALNGVDAPQTIRGASCRFCGSRSLRTFVDLGSSPLCQTHLTREALQQMEPFYPLHALVCEACFLVQLEEFVAPEDIFGEYAYFASYSDSWVEHARRYVQTVSRRFALGADTRVVEIASNDGYLLQHFVAAGVPVLGIEPAANVAAAAREKGVATEVRFFGHEAARDIAARFGRPKLVIGNNVLAHVPALNDFVAGLRELLADDGVLTMEFPHLLQLIEQTQFDTIYHEHFSYFSFTTVEAIFARHGITLFDVEELATHGGSLRIYGRHAGNNGLAVTSSVSALRNRERERGMLSLDYYAAFANRVAEVKRRLLQFLIEARDAGKRVVGYGAPGKGNTLLNYCGIRTDFLDFTVDANPYKQGKFTPGTRIPILAPEAIRDARPDYVLILPWNLRDEISAKAAFIREWGGRFVVPIPTLEVLP